MPNKTRPSHSLLVSPTGERATYLALELDSWTEVGRKWLGMNDSKVFEVSGVPRQSFQA
jgi:hypothetical protein